MLLGRSVSTRTTGKIRRSDMVRIAWAWRGAGRDAGEETISYTASRASSWQTKVESAATKESEAMKRLTHGSIDDCRFGCVSDVARGERRAWC